MKALCELGSIMPPRFMKMTAMKKIVTKYGMQYIIETTYL